ncbi:MAG TPA: methyltransferase domain-containing protein [Thermoanaerobaculia bacterium]|jgi:predicted SAM-dependent methyltransferase
MTKLHLGCGPVVLPGWVNIDNQPYPGIDQVLDVTQGLPFENARFVFAEHFIEHIPYPVAVNLLRECRRVLSDDGVLRLSTPNLDWVWATHYRLGMTEQESNDACFYMNRAFRGWGHQFLYNETTLRATLNEAGFSQIVRVEYGQSTHPELQNLERHEKSLDYGSLSHILIVEASGRGGAMPESYTKARDEFLRDLGVV